MFWIIGGDVLFIAVLHLFHLPVFDRLAHQFEHSAWNGFTFWDLIFPLFIFITGASLVQSLNKRLERGDPKSKLYRHIFIRTGLLLLLATIYNEMYTFDFEHLRYTGVLQRIAISYLFAALIYMWFYNRIRLQIVATLAILLGYWAILIFIPVPGLGYYTLTPEGNLVGYIDRLFLPGIYCCEPYNIYGDNEGLLGYLPAVASCMLGVLAGEWIRKGDGQIKRATGLIASGLVLLGIGLAWNLVFPINKILWSSSYVVYAGGWSAILFGVFFWLMDVKGHRKWAFPWIVIGANAILIYMAVYFVDFGKVVEFYSAPLIGYLGEFKDAYKYLNTLLIEWLLLYLLYRKRIFIRV